MPLNRFIASTPIKVYVGNKILKGKLFTSYKGMLFLRKDSQWVEVDKT